MGKRGPKKVKFGKRMNIFLSHEAIAKISDLTDNRSGYIEALIMREWNLNNA